MPKLGALVSFKIFPPHMGGQKGVALFYQYLSAHLPVWMAASRDNWEPIEAPYEVEKLLYPNRKMPFNLGITGTLATKIISGRIDYIIAEHSYTGWLGWLLKKRTGRPFIIHSHNIECFRFRQMGRRWWWMYKSYERWIHRRADHSFFKTEDDMFLAMRSFGLSSSKCSLVPYGVEETPVIESAKEKLREAFGISSQYIFHFNGTLDYEPNIEAVESLLTGVAPLLEEAGMDFTILVSGKRLPVELQERISRSRSVRYLDFVPDINLLYQGSDLFLNTVDNDSGVKTKLVEALANHCPVVSTLAGAAGIPLQVCGSNLITTEGKKWKQFAAAVQVMCLRDRRPTPGAFFDYYLWTNIAARTAKIVEEISSKK